MNEGNFIRSWTEIIGRTIERVHRDGSRVFMTFTDGERVVLWADAGWEPGDQEIVIDNEPDLDPIDYLNAGWITDDEYTATMHEQDRRRTARNADIEKRELARLKAKYPGEES